MTLQFILGRNNQDKLQVIFDQIMKRSIKKNKQTYYLIPDHIKFESEMTLLELIKRETNKTEAGLMNLQVYSFTRLAWLFLQGHTIMNQTNISELGLSMLLRKIIQENESSLNLFAGQSQLPGFIDKLTSLFMEFRNGNISSHDIESMVENSETNTDYRLKLEDIHLLYKLFIQEIIGKYVSREDLFNTLIEEIKKRDLSDTVFIIDHYQSFSAKEQEIILQLAYYSKTVYVNLTLDKAYRGQKPQAGNLFYEPAKAYFNLYHNAVNKGIEVGADQIIQNSPAPVCQGIHALEKYWVNSTNGFSNPSNYQTNEVDVSQSIKFRKANTIQTEVLHLTTTIKRLVKTENYRYKDFLILTRDYDKYKLILEPEFKKNQIPYFVDQTQSMKDHPLYELIESFLLITKRYFHYEDIMRFIRTGLFIPEDSHLATHGLSREEWRDYVDIAENVMIAYGYSGKDWLNDEDWQYARFNLEESSQKSDLDYQFEKKANIFRVLVRAPLVKFYQELKTVTTNKDFARLLYTTITNELKVDEQIINWRNQANDNGNIEEGRQHEQVWKTWCDLLDEFVELLGDQEFDLSQFLVILETGFANASYKMVPPAIDQVVVSDFSTSRIGYKKVVFCVGMDDLTLPADIKDNSILTDDEREVVSQNLSQEKYLSPTSAELMNQEPFVAYQAFTTASEVIYFSYAAITDTGEELKPSPYIDRLKRYFNLPVENLTDQVDISHSDSLADSLAFIGSRSQTISQLIKVARQTMDQGLPLNPFWSSLAKELRTSLNQAQEKGLKTTYEKIFNSLSAKNCPKNLSQEQAEKLYGKDLNLSVSQIESYYLDPYSHFLQYGLKLKERKELELTPLEMGNFYHEALDLIFSKIISQNIDIRTVTPETFNQLAGPILEEMLNLSSYKVLKQSPQMEYLSQRLQETVFHKFNMLKHQFKKTNAQPQKTEVLFGRIAGQKGVKGLEYGLKNKGTLQLSGKIDRIDIVKGESGRNYLNVIDYKSSNPTLQYKEVYAGLMLQLLVYLKTATLNAKKLFNQIAQPGGAFYSPVNYPFLKVNKLKGNDLLRNSMAKQKHSGLLLNQEDYLTEIDPDIDGYSELFSMRKNKKNSVYKHTSSRNDFMLSEEELDRLLDFIDRKIIQAGNQIISGDLSLSPYYEKKTFTPSVNGIYHPISQFDVLLPENNYKFLGKEFTEENLQFKEEFYKLIEKLGADDNG